MADEESKALERAYSIIKECGLDSQHYLSLNKENHFFFGSKTSGVVSFILIGKQCMSIGDPVCKEEDLELFTDEYLRYCQKMKWKPIFNSVSDRLAEILRKRDYIVLKYGEEAILNLPEYTLSRGSRAALRRNVSKVGKNGIVLKEYCPQKVRDYSLEEKIEQLSKQWYDDKEYKIGYSVGSLDFEYSYDRRFFVTMDEKGKLQTFISFLPYDHDKKFCIDIMHRRIDAITGIMEHAIASAVMKMKDEGILEVSLGIAPLAGIDIEKPETSRIEKLLNSIFNYMDYGYNFKNLYRFKKKFGPTLWKPRYLVYNSGISLVKLGISIAKARQEATNPILYAKYLAFFIADILGLHKT